MAWQVTPDPPQGQSFLTPGDRGSEATAQRAVDLSRQLGDGLLDEFTAGYDRLFALLDGLKAEDWEKPCFHRRGPMPMHDYVALRLQELALPRLGHALRPRGVRRSYMRTACRR